jgi:hypothetical protein
MDDAKDHRREWQEHNGELGGAAAKFVSQKPGSGFHPILIQAWRLMVAFSALAIETAEKTGE